MPGRVLRHVEEVGRVRSEERRAVAIRKPSALVEKLVGAVKLHESECSRDVGEVVLEAGGDDVVGPRPSAAYRFHASRLIPWRDIVRARSAMSSRSVTNMPPSPVVIVFVA